MMIQIWGQNTHIVTQFKFLAFFQISSCAQVYAKKGYIALRVHFVTSHLTFVNLYIVLYLLPQAEGCFRRQKMLLISSVWSELRGLHQTFKSLKICLTHMQLTYCSLWSVLGPVSVTVGIDGGKDVLLVQFTMGFATLLWWLLVPSDDESSS